MPSLVACKGCGAFETEPMYFNIETGELFCRDCIQKDAVCCPLEVITAMRHIVFSELNKLFALQINAGKIPLLTQICEKYLIMSVGKNFKTLDFYKAIAN